MGVVLFAEMDQNHQTHVPLLVSVELDEGDCFGRGGDLEDLFGDPEGGVGLFEAEEDFYEDVQDFVVAVFGLVDFNAGDEFWEGDLFEVFVHFCGVFLEVEEDYVSHCEGLVVLFVRSLDGFRTF